MVTKGIITSIDFNGNTCKVRIPFFETAGNDPIIGTAIVSNTPGSYNGYKVGDVVLVAFEDGKMQNPVIVGKLYLGAAKEKQDPRGTINVETTTASKSASLPADAVLTANVDSNVPNTNTPFGSLASIANNLNSLNTDVNQLDRFTRNQFNSVITDVNDQGEQIRSEIKQTAENIENKVVHKHKDGSQKALGWDLNDTEWKINAQDTVTDENGETKVKDINIVTIDRGGMSIAGDLKLNGYPKNITVRYVQNDSDTVYPALYNFKVVSFPSTFIDKTWYYGKYIKITEAGEEKYVLVSKENFEQYDIKIGITIAYSREISSNWSTEAPKRVDGQYIWQWTRTETYSFDKNNDVWIEKDDDRVVCITGARGETGTSVSECKTYYSLSNKPGGPEATDDNIASGPPKVNEWSTSPQAFDKTLHQDYIYWTVERRVYTDPAKIVWGTPVKASMLSVDFIDSLGITANKITVLQDNTADPSDSNKILFEADGLSGEGIVKIGGFNVGTNSLESGTSNTSNYVKLGTDEIKLGTNFSVDSTGAIKSTSGTIGNLKVTSNGLVYDGSWATYFRIGGFDEGILDPREPASAIYARTQRIDNCIMGFNSNSYGESFWVEFSPEGYCAYKSSNAENASLIGKIPYDWMNRICWLHSTLGATHYGDSATCTQIIVFNAEVGGEKYQTYDLGDAYGINEIIGAQLTERDTASTGSNNQWFSVDSVNKTSITIQNTTTKQKKYSVLIIAV